MWYTEPSRGTVTRSAMALGLWSLRAVCGHDKSECQVEVKGTVGTLEGMGGPTKV